VRGAWTARGLRVTAPNALLADVVPSYAYGRAYGFERAVDNLGAMAGPLLVIALVAAVGTRWAIGLSVIPGMLAVLAVVWNPEDTATNASRTLTHRSRHGAAGQSTSLLASRMSFDVRLAGPRWLARRREFDRRWAIPRVVTRPRHSLGKPPLRLPGLWPGPFCRPSCTGTPLPLAAASWAGEPFGPHPRRVQRRRRGAHPLFRSTPLGAPGAFSVPGSAAFPPTPLLSVSPDGKKRRLYEPAHDVPTSPCR